MAIAVFVILLFIPHVNNKIVFTFAALISTLLPDIDMSDSTVGKRKAFRFLQFFVEHRGPIHSLTLCIIISIILSFFFPILAFPFFLGYSVHLLSDSFTKEGITPFWPYDRKVGWRLRTGGVIESSIFLVFLLVDIFLAIFTFLSF